MDISEGQKSAIVSVCSLSSSIHPGPNLIPLPLKFRTEFRLSIKEEKIVKLSRNMNKKYGLYWGTVGSSLLPDVVDEKVVQKLPKSSSSRFD